MCSPISCLPIITQLAHSAFKSRAMRALLHLPAVFLALVLFLQSSIIVQVSFAPCMGATMALLTHSASDLSLEHANCLPPTPRRTATPGSGSSAFPPCCEQASVLHIIRIISWMVISLVTGYTH